MSKVDQRIAELDTFFQENGHSNVPDKYPPNQKLANWVRNIRSSYAIQKATNGKKRALNKIQQKKMKELNFCFRVHNFKRPKFEKFETLSRLICAYEIDYPLATSRVDFNSRTADLPEKYSRLPELCADIQTAGLSKEYTKLLTKMGVRFLSSASSPATNVATRGNQFVIFEDPPAAERRTANLTADSTNGNPPPSPLLDPHNHITHSSCNVSGLATGSPPEDENIIELVEKIGTVVLDDITNKVEESSPPEKLSVKSKNSETRKKAARSSTPKAPTRTSARARKPRKQTNL